MDAFSDAQRCARPPCSASSALAELRHRVSQNSSGPSGQQHAIQQCIGMGRADNGSSGSLQSKLPTPESDRHNFSRIASASAHREPDAAAAVRPGNGMAGKAKAGFLGKHFVLF